MGSCGGGPAKRFAGLFYPKRKSKESQLSGSVKLTRREERFLKEAQASWGEADAALARWCFLWDLDPEEAQLISSLSAKLSKGWRGRSPEEKSSCLAFQLLAEPTLRYGISEKAAPLRRADRLTLLRARGSSLSGMGWSWSRRPGLALSFILFDVFVGSAGLAFALCLSAAFAQGHWKVGLYAAWAAMIAFSIKLEPMVRARSPWLPSLWALKTIFPVVKKSEQAQEELARELSVEGRADAQRLRAMLSKDIVNPDSKGARDKAWDARMRALSDAFALNQAIRKENGEEDLSEDRIHHRVRQEALSRSEEQELEALIESSPSAKSNPGPRRRSL